MFKFIINICFRIFLYLLWIILFYISYIDFVEENTQKNMTLVFFCLTYLLLSILVFLLINHFIKDILVSTYGKNEKENNE